MTCQHSSLPSNLSDLFLRRQAAAAAAEAAAAKARAEQEARDAAVRFARPRRQTEGQVSMPFYRGFGSAELIHSEPWSFTAAKALIEGHVGGYTWSSLHFVPRLFEDCELGI